MIMTLIGLLLAIIVLGVIIWGVQRILAVLPVAEPFKTIAYVLIVIVCVIIAVMVIARLLHVPLALV